jgi:hypothetical protein
LRSWGVSVPALEGTYESFAQDGSRIAFGTTTINPNHSGALRITVIGARGDTLVARDVAFAGIPLSRQTADSLIAGRLKSFRPAPNSKTPPPAPTDVADEIESRIRARMPAASSPYGNLTIGLDYSLWLSSPYNPKVREYTVLDDHGNPLGTVVLSKPGVRLAAVTRSNIWTVEYDANDLPSLVRYKIVR